MADAPQSPAPRRSLLPPERRRDITRWLGGGLAGLFFAALIGFPDAISGSLAAIPYWFIPLVAPVLFCAVTLFELGCASSRVPIRLQLMLLAGAVLAGFVWTWVAGLVSNSWFGIISFIILMTAIRVAADRLIKISAKEPRRRNGY